MNKKRKKKTRLEHFIAGAISGVFAGIAALGAGYMIGAISKEFLDDSIGAFLVCMGAIFLLLAVALTVQGYIHELGHMLFGILTGYQFQAIRFGSLMFVKMDGKLKIRKLKIAGTRGQCLMLPPECDGNDYPTGLYNWGGCIADLCTALLCLVCFLLLPERISIGGMFLFVFGIAGFGSALLNGIPLSSLSNDGSNAGLLKKSEKARRAFKIQLLINNQLTKGIHIREMPEEWFVFDSETEALDNPLTVSAAVMRFSYLMEIGRLEDAEKLGQHLLNNAQGIATIHESILRAELLFCAMMLREETEQAKKMYQDNKKKFDSLNTIPSMPRIRYAYYLLVEKNEEEAKKQLELFEKLAKKYPYPVEIEGERKLIQMAEDKAERKLSKI